MTYKEHTPTPDDSPAIDGMLRQFAHEEEHPSREFVARIMDAVQEAEEEIHPPIIVIPPRFIALAASIVVVLALAIWFATRPGVCGVVTSSPVYVMDGNRLEKRLPGEGLFEGETIRAKSLTSFDLVDGTTVTLDNGAVLTLEEPESSERIKLKLTKGKSLFRVAKGKGRFLIDAGVPVEVLGTTFGVRRENEETVVAVYEGRVQMGGETGVILTRGRSAHTEYGSQHPVDYPVPPNQELSWAREEVGFVSTELSTVLNWISQNSSYMFTVKDESLNGRRVNFGYTHPMNFDLTVKAFLENYGLANHDGLSYSIVEESD